MVKYEKYQTKIGKNKWEYYEYYGLDSKTGKQIRLRGKGFDTKAEAKVDFQRKLKTLQDGENITSAKKIPFKTLLTEYLEYYENTSIKPGTYKKLKDEMNRYALPLMKDMYITEIDVNDCQKVYDQIRSKRKDHRKIKNQIKTVLDFGISKQYMTSNPMVYVLVSKVEPRYKKRRLDSAENSIHLHS